MHLASHIEHTNLLPTLTIRDIDTLVAEALQHRFLGVCVPPFWVKRASREIAGRSLLLITVVGFPLGYQLTETKLDEMKRVIDHGADELDVVWNISSFKTGIPWTKIDVAKCTRLAHDHQKIVKVIIETAFLNNEEVTAACKLCADAGADFVKTSTGFAPAGAQVDTVKLMRSVLPTHVGIKASGGIKTADQARALIEAGADRLGTSSAIKFVTSTAQPQTQ
jgi:deoxyribose-phosphate aldolase